MDRIKDSSAFRPSTTQINEEDRPADRAARKEMERVRLRKLLNQGKKKRRRLNLPTNGTSDDFHCQTCGPHVPRKLRSVGHRRRSKSWKLIGLRLFSDQIELAMPSAPTKDDKFSQLSLRNEIEIEFEIAEVLSGLKKQVSSLLTNDLEKIPVEDDPKLKLERSTCYLGTSVLCADLSESTQSNQPEPTKFIIDLNEPPPLESGEQLTAYSDYEMKSEPEEATATRFVRPRKLEVKDEVQDLDLGSSDCYSNGKKQLFQKQQEGYSFPSIENGLLDPERISPTQGISYSAYLNSIQHGKQGLEFYSYNFNQENNARCVSSLHIKDEHANHQIHDPLLSGRTMAGPLIFPVNQTRTTAMANHLLSPPSNKNFRVRYPSRAPFLSVLPRNICNNDGQNGERNNHLFPFLDQQLRPSQMCLPIEIQQQNHPSHSTQETADNRIVSGLTNVFPQTQFPLHSRSVVLMPSASSDGSGQWKHVLKRGRTQCPSDEVCQAPNLSMPHNHVVAPGFLDKAKYGSQIVPGDHGGQYRHSEMTIQRINQADSTLPAGNSTSWMKRNGFVLKSCSPVPSCKMSFSTQKAMAASQLKQHQQPTTAEVSNGFLYDRSPSLQNPQLKLTIPNSHIQI